MLVQVDAPGMESVEAIKGGQAIRRGTCSTTRVATSHSVLPDYHYGDGQMKQKQAQSSAVRFTTSVMCTYQALPQCTSDAGCFCSIPGELHTSRIKFPTQVQIHAELVKVSNGRSTPV